MANTSSPVRASRNAPQSKAHRYIDALIGDDFGRLSKLTISSANAFARKKLDSASQSLQLRSERREKASRRIEIREWRAAERSIAAESRESDQRIRAMWRSLKTKVPPQKKVRHTPPKARKRDWPYAAVALPKYGRPVIDRRGQRGVFMRVRYYSRRTAEAGVSQRVVRYCFHGAELDENGRPYVASNIGLDIDEALCGFDHLEQINWSAARNAKLLVHGIFAVDHRQSPDEMMTCGVRWAEQTLAKFDLPYLVTLHAPPADGDDRNWHLHILWSYRPMFRTGDHEWQVAEMLRTDLDNPAAMKVFREIFAAVMTDVSFEAGQNQVWTAKSNADRGLVHEPQVHLGAARTNRARSGEYVAENEENHERVMRSTAAVIDDLLRHADEALAKTQAVLRAFNARFARLPKLPMKLPTRVTAAAIALDLPTFRKVLPRSNISISIPAIPVPTYAAPARIPELNGPVQRWLFAQASVETIAHAAPKPLPRPAHVEIANLRIVSLPLATTNQVKHSGLPTQRPQTSSFVLPAAPSVGSSPLLPTSENGVVALVVAADTVRSSNKVSPVALPRATLSLPVIPVPKKPIAATRMPKPASISAPPVPADTGFIDGLGERIKRAKVLAEQDRQRDRDDAEKEANRTAIRRQTIDALLLAITSERHFLALDGEHRIVYPELLARFGLKNADVADDDAQARLADIAKQQTAEIAQCLVYVSSRPGDLQRDCSGWLLNKTAPNAVQELFAAWRNDRSVKAAFENFAAQHSVVVDKPVRQAEPVKPIGSAWREAREGRERVMAAWDEHERLDGAGMARPGQEISRPGLVDPPVRTGPLRRFPGAFGHGFGD